MTLSWSYVVALVAVLIFFYLVFRVLLEEKAIGQKNTIRFAALVVGIVLALAVVFIPIANAAASSSLVGIIGVIFGYVIRDVAGPVNKT